MRYATAFGSYTFPSVGLPVTDGFAVRRASVVGVRQDGALDAYGNSRSPLQPLPITLPLFLTTANTEADLDTLVRAYVAAMASGRDKLYYNFVGGVGVGPELYRFAKPDAPSIEYLNHLRATAQASFLCYDPLLYENLGNTIDSYIAGSSEVTVADANFGESADWETPRIFAAVTVSSSPTNFTVTAWPGDLRTTRVIVRVEALGANGAVNPKVENQTTLQSVKYNGTLTTSGVYQVNATVGIHGFRRSTDGGANWVDAWNDSTIEATQVGGIELAAGNNTFQVTADGTPNFRVMLLAKPAYGMP